MKIPLIILAILLFIKVCGAFCSEEQININFASQKNLEELHGIGEVKAQAIVDARPFDSVDDLIDVKGIGEVTLSNIINQGLACVGDYEEVEKKEVNEGNFQEGIKKEIEEVKLVDNIKEEPEPIILEPKTIKKEDALKSTRDKKSLEKSDYARYGFLGFCVLLVILLVIRNRRYQNEFE